MKTCRELVKLAFDSRNKDFEQFVKKYPEMNNELLDADAGMRMCEDDHDPVWFEGDYCPVCEMRTSFEDDDIL